MEASHSPEYLKSTRQAVIEFRGVFVRFLEFMDSGQYGPRGIAPAVMPLDTADDAEVARLKREVGIAAGRASEAATIANTFVRVRDTGTIDPIGAWHSVTQPHPILEPDDILSACDHMIGRLEVLASKAEIEGPAVVGVASLHPLIWEAAKRLWNGGHFREAVVAGAEALITNVKALTNRQDVADTALWQETFSIKDPEKGKPRLRWPGDPSNRSVKSMNDGLRQFAAGVQMTIRNGAVHSVSQLNEQEALEQLATISLLSRYVDACDLLSADSERE